MIETQIAIIGGGPAGLQAATAAGQTGAQVLLIDNFDRLGGQLVKQTHMFFGSQQQFAGTRGIDTATKLPAGGCVRERAGHVRGDSFRYL